MAENQRAYVRNSERLQIHKLRKENMFLRRLGQSGLQCSYGHHCPQILERTDGDFVAVGLDITEEAAPVLPPGPGIGPKERAVRIPRQVMVAARAELPAA